MSCRAWADDPSDLHGIVSEGSPLLMSDSSGSRKPEELPPRDLILMEEAHVDFSPGGTRSIRSGPTVRGYRTLHFAVFAMLAVALIGVCLWPSSVAATEVHTGNANSLFDVSQASRAHAQGREGKAVREAIVSVWSFWQPGYSEHTCHTDKPWQGETKKDIEFYALRSKVNGSKPVYSFWNGHTLDSTLHMGEPRDGEKQIAGVQFYAFQTWKFGTEPVYSFWNSRDRDTTCHMGMAWKGEVQQQIEFYAYPRVWNMFPHFDTDVKYHATDTLQILNHRDVEALKMEAVEHGFAGFTVTEDEVALKRGVNSSLLRNDLKYMGGESSVKVYALGPDAEVLWPNCSDSGQNCILTQCCMDPDTVCYKKNHSFAECLPTCHQGDMRAAVNGTHADERWDCEALGRPHLPSLFCITAIRSDPEGREFQLLELALRRRAGIFACDDFAVFSDRNVSLGDSVTAMQLEHFAAKKGVQGALTATWVNTPSFVEAWAVVLNLTMNGSRRGPFDWFVKTDPDAVFFPTRLKTRLEGHYDVLRPHLKLNGTYIRNCKPLHPGDLTLYGSMEVLSWQALQMYRNGSHACLNEDQAGKMGEDMWLQQCLDKLGVWALEDWSLLSDGYCMQAEQHMHHCSGDAVAYHPFKAREQWMGCWEMASPGAAKAWEVVALK